MLEIGLICDDEKKVKNCIKTSFGLNVFNKVFNGYFNSLSFFYIKLQKMVSNRIQLFDSVEKRIYLLWLIYQIEQNIPMRKNIK